MGGLYSRNSVSDPEELTPAIMTAAAAVERGGREWWTITPGPPMTPGETSGEIDGERLASGDKLGEKDGDMAVVKLPSWLIGERGKEGIGAN